jgi:type I restriction enzyme S subunit
MIQSFWKEIGINTKLIFGESAELRSEKVDPKFSQHSYYIGLEHIEQQSLSLAGYGFGADVDSQKQKFYEGDILFGKLRPYFRKVVVAPFDGICSTDIWVVKPKKGIDRNFLFYWMASEDFIESSTYASEGGRMPRAKWDWVSKFELELRTPLEQIAIGKALRILDEKTASNNALSKTLEGIAQTIYKSWFIDFDPVKAKMAGKKPVGMDAATAALFPDSMEESELGLIPKGWKVNLLGELITPKKGKTITKATCVDGEVPVVAGGLQPAYFHNKANVSQPAITVSASGANAGFVRLYLKDIWASDCSYINYEITQTVHFWYLYLLRNQEVIYGMQQGAAQPHIYPSDLMRLRLSYPSSIDSVLKFEETVAPLFLEIGVLERQNELLRIQRDSLLPRLISGELQIPEEMLAS